MSQIVPYDPAKHNIADLLRQLDIYHAEHLSTVKKEVLYDNSRLNLLNKQVSDNKDIRVLVALKNRHAVGLILCEIKWIKDHVIFKDYKYAVIHDLVVDKDHRHQGLGSDLLLEAEHQLFQEGAESIEINVYAFNETAIDFYAKSGYADKHKTVVKNRR